MTNNDFVAEILRATGSLRSGDPSGTTDIIQAALVAGGLSSSAAFPGSRNPTASKSQRAVEPDAPCIERTLVEEGLDDSTSGATRPEQRRSERLRRPLGEVVRTLTASRKDIGLEGKPPGRAPDLPLPEGAEFRDLTHACAAGARRYRLYVPASAEEGLRALVVMLHGCTQNPEDFAAGTGMNALAEEHRLIVVYPAQTGGDNSMSCWNWFRPGDQMRGAGEPAIIASLTASVRDQYAIATDRVFVAGLSAGGAMAVIMGETYPELFGAIGVHSGLAYGSANDVMSAFTAMRGQVGIEREPSRNPGGGPEAGPRVIVFHGSADTTVHPLNAGRIIANQGGSRGKTSQSEHGPSGTTRGYTRLVAERDDGTHGIECWMIEGAQHAWSGGHPSGSYTDPRGPNASAAMVRFFLDGASGNPARFT